MSAPRIDRLLTDNQKLIQLTQRSPFVQILETQGNPPNSYLIRFTCRGVEHIDSHGQPIYREDHRVQITLGSQYPLEKPSLQWLTPIYHPNISVNGSVCIGNNWASGGRYLDELVVYLMQMVRFDGENLTFTVDAFRRDAYQWALANRRLLPVDNRPMFPTSIGEIRVRSSNSQVGGLSINVRNSGSDLDIQVRPRS